jgi:hypothetical protein
MCGLDGGQSTVGGPNTNIKPIHCPSLSYDDSISMKLGKM